MAVQGEWLSAQEYLPFLCGLVLIAGVSFVDDIRSLPDSVRLVAQFVAMALMFWSMGIMHWDMWWIVVIALIVCVGATNVRMGRMSRWGILLRNEGKGIA